MLPEQLDVEGSTRTDGVGVVATLVTIEALAVDEERMNRHTVPVCM
jgi:hypothetical protein